MADRSFEKLARDLSSDFTSLRDDVRRLTDLVAELANEGADQARGRASTFADQARDRFSSTVDQARDRVSSTADRLAGHASDVGDRVRGASAEFEARVERNPLTAVMIAIVGGLLIGAMSRSRR